MFFLTPRFIKEGKHYRHALKRLIHYKEDVLPAADLATLRELLSEMQGALRSRSRERIAAVRERVDAEVGRIAPPPRDAAWRENVEVFLVAIVIAAGVRAYVLQPFKIPTGSMQPTLHGIIGTPTDTPPPNLLVRAFDLVVRGRHHVDRSAAEDDVVQAIREKTYLNFFTFTTVEGRRSSYTLFAPEATLRRDFGLHEGMTLRKGEPFARGRIDTGDQVFVDKVSYNFVPPSRGDVFVFKTTGIQGIRMPPGVESQHYIKRLAGMPGDTLRIAPPTLFIDDQPATEPGFRRVMSETDGYQGYSNQSASGVVCPLLGSPDAPFTVPEKTYFALGDNSYNSSDSRFWGIVPDRNVSGRGFFVYWPFSERWGLIR